MCWQICLPYLAMWLHQFRKSTCIKFKETLKTAPSCCSFTVTHLVTDWFFGAASFHLFPDPQVPQPTGQIRHHTPHRVTHRINTTHVKVPGSYLSHAGKLPQNFFKKSCLMGMETEACGSASISQIPADLWARWWEMCDL